MKKQNFKLFSEAINKLLKTSKHIGAIKLSREYREPYQKYLTGNIRPVGTP